MKPSRGPTPGAPGRAACRSLSPVLVAPGQPGGRMRPPARRARPGAVPFPRGVGCSQSRGRPGARCRRAAARSPGSVRPAGGRPGRDKDRRADRPLQPSARRPRAPFGLLISDHLLSLQVESGGRRFSRRSPAALAIYHRRPWVCSACRGISRGQHVHVPGWDSRRGRRRVARTGSIPGGRAPRPRLARGRPRGIVCSQTRQGIPPYVFPRSFA
jgi:hypothetical protein